ncbi:creatininase family protein [Tellurirhabdus rosea]|uniref:creatininase family protein n=1 Tax=Tellurirhabdus rosea TaxID=2674997 RepID=UPI0022512DB7|nr:creatininase family protein [Tellurirhabdus rosea]
MRPYILAETNWKQIQETRFDLAILPWGATEAHNFHLPYATDVIEADFIAAESARLAWEKGAKIIVLPTIPFGVNTGQTDILLDINLYPSTQLAILGDIIEVLNRQGIHKLLILNSHGGNDFRWMLRELGVRYPDMLLATCSWFAVLDKSKYFDEPKGDHADEMETSLLLHFRPDLVTPLDQTGDGTARQWTIQGMREGWAWAERRWSEVTADTGIGNPKKATAEKGKRYFEDVTEKISGLLVELAAADRSKLYE